MQDQHHAHLRHSFDLAMSSVEAGNHPFGAILVMDGEVLLQAQNSVITDHDVTRHAEMNLISQASQNFSREQLKAATLYSSTEPCAMCSGAIAWSGIRKVVYGCSAQTLGFLANDAFVGDCRMIFHLTHEIFQVEGPLLEEEASTIHHSFWHVT